LVEKDDARASGQTTGTLTYEFVNVWPVNMTSMPVRYGDSDILKCSIQFAYDRYHTSFIDSSANVNPTPIATPDITTKEFINRNPGSTGTGTLNPTNSNASKYLQDSIRGLESDPRATFNERGLFNNRRFSSPSGLT